MADSNIKCAHEGCGCMVMRGGEWGKYCSEHCKHMAGKIELRCECRHPQCR